MSVSVFLQMFKADLLLHHIFPSPWIFPHILVVLYQSIMSASNLSKGAAKVLGWQRWSQAGCPNRHLLGQESRLSISSRLLATQWSDYAEDSAKEEKDGENTKDYPALWKFDGTCLNMLEQCQQMSTKHMFDTF